MLRDTVRYVSIVPRCHVDLAYLGHKELWFGSDELHDGLLHLFFRQIISAKKQEVSM